MNDRRCASPAESFLCLCCRSCRLAATTTHVHLLPLWSRFEIVPLLKQLQMFPCWLAIEPVFYFPFIFSPVLRSGRIICGHKKETRSWGAERRTKRQVLSLSKMYCPKHTHFSLCFLQPEHHFYCPGLIFLHLNVLSALIHI